jgi:hypothetical protein
MTCCGSTERSAAPALPDAALMAATAAADSANATPNWRAKSQPVLRISSPPSHVLRGIRRRSGAECCSGKVLMPGLNTGLVKGGLIPRQPSCGRRGRRKLSPKRNTPGSLPGMIPNTRRMNGVMSSGLAMHSEMEGPVNKGSTGGIGDRHVYGLRRIGAQRDLDDTSRTILMLFVPPSLSMRTRLWSGRETARGTDRTHS